VNRYEGLVGERVQEKEGEKRPWDTASSMRSACSSRRTFEFENAPNNRMKIARRVPMTTSGRKRRRNRATSPRLEVVGFIVTLIGWPREIANQSRRR